MKIKHNKNERVEKKDCKTCYNYNHQDNMGCVASCNCCRDYEYYSEDTEYKKKVIAIKLPDDIDKLLKSRGWSNWIICPNTSVTYNHPIYPLSLEVSLKDNQFRFEYSTILGVIIRTGWLSPITNNEHFDTWLHRMMVIVWKMG